MEAMISAVSAVSRPIDAPPMAIPGRFLETTYSVLCPEIFRPG
jgi:hypothetical protein